MFVKRTLFVFLSVFALSTAIDPNNICVLVADGTKIVDDTNCAAYYTCKNGQATATNCPSGYYFNKDTKACVTKAQATCISTEELPCAGIADGTFVAMAGSCSGYYYCKNQVASAGQCPNNLIFNPKEQKCQYSHEYACTIAGGSVDADVVIDDPQVVCAYVPEGIFFGNAASCNTWHKCMDNKLASGTCGTFVFNVQSQECVYENTYTCQQLDGDSSQTGGTPLGNCEEQTVTVKKSARSSAKKQRNARNINKSQNIRRKLVKPRQKSFGEESVKNEKREMLIKEDRDNTIEDSNDLSAGGTDEDSEEPIAGGTEEESDESTAGGTEEDSDEQTSEDTEEDTQEETDEDETEVVAKKHRDPDSCSSYLTCVKEKFVRTKCGGGLYFSLTDQKCTKREDAVNKCDRCQGSALNFVNAHNDDCHGYFYCANGRKSGGGTCLNDLYFNEKLGSCSVTEVKFKACQKASYAKYDELA